MSKRGLQQGRGIASWKAPKDFSKAEKGFKDVFDVQNKTAADDKRWKPIYSRVTHKSISKASQGKPL